MNLAVRARVEGAVNRSVRAYADTFLWFRERLQPTTCSAQSSPRCATAAAAGAILEQP
jgi:hypothetical protein